MTSSPMLLVLLATIHRPDAKVPTQPTVDDVRGCIARGVDFLLRDQNPDGSWGSVRNDISNIFWSNPETHRAWIVATTALVCMAFEQLDRTPGALSDAHAAAVRSAYDRGIDYVLKNFDVKRPNDWDLDNVWAYVYGLQILADAYQNPRYAADNLRREKLKSAGQNTVDTLWKYQTASGGWGYYDFEVHAQPSAWATSFTTAVGVMALASARDAGWNVDPKRFEIAARALRRCRLPNGAYTYSVDGLPNPGRSEWIDQVKGALGRIQVCNLALLEAGDEVPQEKLKTGVAQFFREHRFLDIARGKPIPHESYYYNSGYFYFFGHYYAAQIIARLPAADRSAIWPRLRYEIIKCQEKDGSMWDYYMNTYHKPYGTSYGLMTLAFSLADESPSSQPAGG